MINKDSRATIHLLLFQYFPGCWFAIYEQMAPFQHGIKSFSQIFLLILLFSWTSSCSFDDEQVDDSSIVPEYPCNIRRLSLDNDTDKLPSFWEEFPNGLPSLYPEPLVMRSSHRNLKFRSRVDREHILSQFPPDFMVTLSSSNALSEHRRRISFQQYLEELSAQPEIPLDQSANETWYLFGETYSPEWQDFYGVYDYEEIQNGKRKIDPPYSDSYQLPPCQSCLADKVALSFGIGNRGSGVQWHTHGPGFSEALVGDKHWILSPDKPPRIHKDQSSQQWMTMVYPELSPSSFRQCTLKPGDMVYFPNEWWHATLNLHPYTAFISTFTTEHEALPTARSVHQDEL